MNLKQKTALLLLLVPAVLLAHDGISSSSKWHIKGALSDACSCAVPCTCMFGRGLRHIIIVMGWILTGSNRGILTIFH